MTSKSVPRYSTTSRITSRCLISFRSCNIPSESIARVLLICIWRFKSRSRLADEGYVIFSDEELLVVNSSSNDDFVSAVCAIDSFLDGLAAFDVDTVTASCCDWIYEQD